MVSEYIQAVVLYFAFFGIPVLIASAFLLWRKRYWAESPAWRTRLGLASMGIIVAYWIGPVLLIFASQLIRLGHRSGDIVKLWTDSVFPAMFLAAALAVTMKGVPRTLTIAASILVIVFRYASRAV